MIKIIQRNKLLFIIAILAIFTSLSVFAASAVTSFKPKYGTLTTSVNFRNYASTSKGKIKTLKSGTSIKMVGSVDKFYVVQLGTNEIGLVSKDYVKNSSTAPKGAKTYTSITPKNYTTTDKVNLRRGPGTNFAKNTTISKGCTVKAIGYIDNWYIVVTNSNLVGCIRKDFLKASSSNTTNNNSNNTNTFSMSANEKIIFDLLNKQRTNAGLSKLSANAKLFKVARLKSEDMVKKSYFSHSSPTYGSPFQMMQKYGITYKVAGENIAGNPSLEAAVTSWMNSATHKQNILSNSYNYIGIGVTKSDTYGFVISTMFIRKIAKIKETIYMFPLFLITYLKQDSPYFPFSILPNLNDQHSLHLDY